MHIIKSLIWHTVEKTGKDSIFHIVFHLNFIFCLVAWLQCLKVFIFSEIYVLVEVYWYETIAGTDS